MTMKINLTDANLEALLKKPECSMEGRSTFPLPSATSAKLISLACSDAASAPSGSALTSRSASSYRPGSASTIQTRFSPGSIPHGRYGHVLAGSDIAAQRRT